MKTENKKKKRKTKEIENKKIHFLNITDQYQYLGNCPPTPPLTRQESIDDKLGLMLG